MGHAQISNSRQIKIYTQKCFRIFKYERGFKLFISAAVITILICFVTSSDMFADYAATRSGAFALVCACVWIGIFNSIQSVCKERDIIKREYRSGLSISAYIIAHFLFEVVICAVEAIIVTVIVVFCNIGNMQFFGVFLPTGVELCITFFLAILSSDVLGLMVSSIVKSTNTAMTAMPFVLIIQLILSGVVFSLDGLARGFAHLTVSKWSLDAICSSADINNMIGVIASNHEYPEDYDPLISNILGCWGMLLLYIALYLVIAIVFLKRVDKDKR